MGVVRYARDFPLWIRVVCNMNHALSFRRLQCLIGEEMFAVDCGKGWTVIGIRVNLERHVGASAGAFSGQHGSRVSSFEMMVISTR